MVSQTNALHEGGKLTNSAANVMLQLSELVTNMAGLLAITLVKPTCD